MKKITFLYFLLTSCMMFGQSLPTNFENPSTTASFEFGGLGFNNIENPDISAGNMSARVLEVNKPDTADWGGGFGFETPGNPLIDLANGTVFTMKVWAPIANQNIRFQIQIGLSGEPTYNRDVTITTAGVWTEVTFDFTGQPGLTGMEQYTVLVIQPNYEVACEGGGCGTVGAGNGGIWYIDDIVQVGAPDPTCMDGVQNGDETGVDCGGPDCPACPESCDDGILNNGEEQIDCGGPNCAPCPATDPTDGPTDSPSTGLDFYVYSDLSGNANQSDFTDFIFDSFGGGVTRTQENLNGNTVIKLENLDFFGNAFGPDAGGTPFTFDATTTYDFVHINYYATTSTAFNFSLVDDSLSATVCCGSAEEPFYRFGSAADVGAGNADAELITGQWVSVFIPFTHFVNYPPLVSGTWDGTDLKQTLFTGNGTVYVDNIFFSTTNVLSTNTFETTEFKVFPNPTNGNWNLLSSNTINNVAVYDILGKQVLTLSPNSSEVAIDASSLITGVYFARIEGVSGSKTIKLVKE
ncbi:T9SS type A sorting domain-containing protein [Winogradskyella luteola]|uniref:T9SS type A sorting domain-containing protein n=1 Tax=Winogradskyella luteola TaxID=2828330 RepID=A0A9X1FB49_9FLAO|nr:T9SS type A sorting domain-containing protein [Winogradskyella luteola]MBV7269390.1 T9SS type A sorting domain-containing protein [Winogradskyella luteola]